MLTLIALIAATQAPTAVASSIAPRMLKDIPGVTINYYDVPGKNPGAIQKSIAKIRPKGSDGKPVTAGYNWTSNAQVTKSTQGTVCTITAAKVQFSGTADLPRLTEPQALEKEELQSWNQYVAGLDAQAAVELGYFADRMAEIEKGLIGQSCDKAGDAYDAAVTKLKAEEHQFMLSRASASPKSN